MAGGKSPRQKGDRLEREIVRLLREAGFPCKRVPLSGSAPDYPGDVTATLPGLGEAIIECKSRASSPLYGWIANRNALVLRGDRQEPLIVFRLNDFLKLLNAPLPEKRY